jgi:hypothetical protein
MNRTQIRLLLAGLVVIVAMGLWPPWKVSAFGAIEESAGYAFLLSPPRRLGVLTAHIDWKRLGMQWTGVALCTAVGILALAERRG